MRSAACVEESGDSREGCFRRCSNREPDMLLFIACPFCGSEDVVLLGDLREPLEARFRADVFADRPLLCRGICVGEEVGESSRS